MRLVRWFNQWMDFWVARQLITEKTHPDKKTLLQVGVLIALVGSSGFWMPEWLRITVLSGLAGGFCAAPIGRRLAYGRGYRNARMDFWAAMVEAHKRQMRGGEWLALEMERDHERYGLVIVSMEDEA